LLKEATTKNGEAISRQGNGLVAVEAGQVGSGAKAVGIPMR